MNLDRFILEVRPTGTLLDSEAIRQPFDEDKCHVVALGPQDVGVFAEVADKLAWGSAVVFVDLNDDALAFVQSVADKAHFNEWIQSPYPGFPDGTRSWVKTSGNNDHYATHLPILLKAVELTEGPVLELGAGEGSTAALHKICVAQKRLLVTVDNNMEYLKKFEYLLDENHVFEHLDDPSTTAWLDKKWGVVFIDHAPGETRGKAVERAKDQADYVTVHDGIPGDFVECGINAGGQPALMGYTLARYGGPADAGRKVHLFDSFDGQPQASIHDCEDYQKTLGVNPDPTKGIRADWFIATIEQVQHNMRAWNVPLDRLVYHKGWLQEVLPPIAADFPAIALLRVDVDLHDSTIPVFEYLYDKVSPGGYIISDDWGQYALDAEPVACRKAALDFFNRRGYPHPKVTTLPRQTGTAWWRKP